MFYVVCVCVCVLGVGMSESSFVSRNFEVIRLEGRVSNRETLALLIGKDV